MKRIISCALERHTCLLQENSRKMTSSERSENSDQSGPLHPECLPFTRENRLVRGLCKW